ncbi:putative toll-like receptor, P-loop containing nucleoside triphosphate hydrolase [Rosa chinensis]|uniref:Putative toll-like receptor, P-loop containing nucleoside triphosphate hydrolase n=1 Tax=Rosa chinensis TaxID=74649 RepID=A0A2P6QM83_ROSCH|nr:putative toll-like receptor, P-loop containing nucleoside triphosphate hydrolase [Rosa chinensis]
MASSSQIACASPPSSDPCWKYDVFLSFRGVDTRKGITVDIHDRLNRSGIKTFMDEQDLQVGDAISPTLLAAIKESRFAINRILPLFYHVEPSDVRYQNKGSFEEAFSKHKTSGRHELEKVKQWRDALYKVANFSGWNTSDYKTHKKLVDAIEEFLRSKVLTDAIESTRDFKTFKATRKAMDEVMKALKDDEVTTIGVYGMGGVGKTTMVRHVGAQAQKRGIFHHVIMAVVSQSPDLEKIQRTLAELLGVKLSEVTEIGRAARLSKQMRRNKILIILDDIWERMDLSKIGVPSYKELQKCNSKVLLTTRIRNVCHVMRCQRNITLSILSKGDSWTLFMRNAGRSFESTNFEDVARRVARECCGLPIALITVARALGDKDLVEWKRAVQRLEKSQTANPDDQGDASKCIKLSYDYLKDEEYKSYFLLCCLFPEDYEIEIEDLFRYAIGKGLFRDADTLEEARERADSVARHLQYSCLLLDADRSWRTARIRCVRMHDVVRDTAIQIVQSEHGFLVRAGCDLKDWPRQLYEGCSAISLMQNKISKLPEKLVCPELQILLLNSNFSMVEIPETFFQGPNKLTVVDLSNTGITLLPESFSLLINLQALCIDRCHNLDTSILGKLKKLEILSMRFCRVKKLSRKMGNLINLRMLDITDAVIDTIPSKVISKFHNLEELYMQGFWNWGSKVEGEGEETNAGFDEVTSLSNLRVLKVCISKAERIPKYVDFKPNWVEFDILIGRDDSQRIFNPYGQKSLSLKLVTISRLPNWFCNALMNTAEKLWWEGRQNFGDIFVEYELMNTIIRVPKEPVFEYLVELHLYFVNGLELCVGELPLGSLFNLKLLEVKFCYNWGNVFLPSNLLLPNLEELNCRFTGGIEYVFGYEALYQPKQSKLRKIELNYLMTVRSICHGPAPTAMFQALQSLTIRRCNFQGSLFTSDVAQCLSQLNYLELHDCPSLERIVEASNKKIILPKLRRLTLLVLPMLSHDSATFECPSLVYLDLWGCPNFSASFSDFHSRETRTYY